MSVFYFWRVVFWLDVFVFLNTAYFGYVYMGYFEKVVFTPKIRLLDIFLNLNSYI